MRNLNFLDVVIKDYALCGIPDLFSAHEPELFDLVIANPPYVRTQILGARAVTARKDDAAAVD